MSLNTPEPAPIPNAGLPVWPMVIEGVGGGHLRQVGTSVTAEERAKVWNEVSADMIERNQIGIAKYGTPLCIGDGRDAAVDAYQELLDGSVYMEKAAIEHKSQAFKYIAAQLVRLCYEAKREIHRLKGAEEAEASGETVVDPLAGQYPEA